VGCSTEQHLFLFDNYIKRGDGGGHRVCSVILCKFRVMLQIWGCVYQYVCHSYADLLDKYHIYEISREHLHMKDIHTVSVSDMGCPLIEVSSF
jgi:hypothetical protein